MTKWILFLCVTSLLCTCDAYKVLVVFSMPGKSHSILGYGIVKHLLKRGHEVTYITPFPVDNADPKLKQIDVSSNIDILPKTSLNLNVILEGKVPKVDHGGIHLVMNAVEMNTYNNENVSRLINDPKQKFDIVIAEWMFTEICASYAAIFNAPLIWVSSIQTHWMVTRLIDEALHPAYNTDVVGRNIPPFNFFQRVQNLWILLRTLYQVKNSGQEDFYNIAVVPVIEKRGLVPPTFEDVQFNGSLVLSNSHLSYAPAVRLPQNYKTVGGFHVEEKVEPLPEDLKKVLDSASTGVIYFSMGSNLKSKEMPDRLRKSLIKLFSGLKYTVIWKFEEEFSGLPKNIHVVKWAPQQSILAHPNCVLFITHGGLLSTIESVHFGVPIITIPVFADQFMNAERSARVGFGKIVYLSYTMADDLKVAIEEIFSNPRYKEIAKETSLIYHDRPVSPGAELVHWVEHVVKTRGALHLRSPALQMPLYQKLYLDLLTVVLVLLIVIYKIVRCLFSRISVTSNKKTN
ncbi:UDP-glucosyltransferase isoform X1 [Bombyx mori]|uniref:UDP-glucuronosyltransferase n=1 Tax=Bombyx mori TaxID=7091 RepID=D6RUU7_BOMMO|nr:UDP-glucosyltransferase precursor [Bombyx mori]XP_012550240.1 UDP-glucosyltransferase isoform X1 [Bombyx mori]XP_037867794.1 UDP-glucosyltransferase isoform X1 [Bombyx mori]AEW43168.1 UDP-glycosyltransferase UGT40G1 [Bombyx mori]BAJ08154.1 UDP-glucosyltransferase [Bombyx mori]